MYKEVNPAVFAIVTFPFLFGVMFGDIGHGGIFLIAGILLVLFNEKVKSVMSMASDIRYLILLMGLFGFYNGWIYNEFFAIPLDVFGSCYYQDATVVNWSPDDPSYGWRKMPPSSDG
jgi:V-type H+-transporting ATPase subunit a